MQNHEIRTPLMGVLGIADMTLRDRSIAAPLRGQLQLIFDSTKALLTTADSILDTSKLQNNMMTMRPAVRKMGRQFKSSQPNKVADDKFQ